jgi:hypothetical protein
MLNSIPKTILFLARSLDRGGAERQLVVLDKGLTYRGHAVAVAVFTMPSFPGQGRVSLTLEN